jgi:peptidoglycan/LPS O-acetylase OafA/YrhL
MAEAVSLKSRQDQPVRSQEKLHALTSLRFFAALFVVSYHTFMVGRFPDLVSPDSMLGHFLFLGCVSVSFFFLLSGYILSMVYLRAGQALRVGTFYRARFARVYPLYFLTLVADTPNLLWPRIAKYGLKSALMKTTVTFLGNAFLIQAWLVVLRGINNPNWSLSVEAFFYLIFPAIGLVLWKLRGVSFWLAAAVLYMGGQAIVTVAARHIAGSTPQFLAFLHPETFALGILLASWQVRSRQAQKAPRTNPLTLYVVLGVALAASFSVVYWYDWMPSVNMYDGLLAPIFACVIWAFSHSDWTPAKLLSAPWLVVLGEASFGLYLIHMPVLHVFEHTGWNRNPWLYPVYLLLCIALSVLSFYYFETPMRKWILKRGDRHVKETMEMASDAQ